MVKLRVQAVGLCADLSMVRNALARITASSKQFAPHKGRVPLQQNTYDGTILSQPLKTGKEAAGSPGAQAPYKDSAFLSVAEAKGLLPRIDELNVKNHRRW